jgi:hypothetical protein
MKHECKGVHFSGGDRSRRDASFSQGDIVQVGCYVPAAHALLTPVDQVFTRIGSSDSIMNGAEHSFGSSSLAEG